MSRLYDFRKYTFPWHNAVSHFMINLAVAVTFLANLCQFQNCIRDPESRPDRKCTQIIAFYDQVLSERPKIHFRTSCPECLDLPKRQQAHLSVPFSAVRIAFDAPVFDQICFLGFVFLCTAFFTDTDA